MFGREGRIATSCSLLNEFVLWLSSRSFCFLKVVVAHLSLAPAVSKLLWLSSRSFWFCQSCSGCAPARSGFLKVAVAQPSPVLAFSKWLWLSSCSFQMPQSTRNPPGRTMTTTTTTTTERRQQRRQPSDPSCPPANRAQGSHIRFTPHSDIHVYAYMHIYIYIYMCMCIYRERDINKYIYIWQ